MHVVRITFNFNTRTRTHPKASKLQCQMPHAKHSPKEELAERLPKPYQDYRNCKTNYWTEHCPLERKDPAVSKRT